VEVRGKKLKGGAAGGKSHRRQRGWSTSTGQYML